VLALASADSGDAVPFALLSLPLRRESAGFDGRTCAVCLTAPWSSLTWVTPVPFRCLLALLAGRLASRELQDHSPPQLL